MLMLMMVIAADDNVASVDLERRWRGMRFRFDLDVGRGEYGTVMMRMVRPRPE